MKDNFKTHPSDDKMDGWDEMDWADYGQKCFEWKLHVEAELREIYDDGSSFVKIKEILGDA